jgi:hypothetical protein
MKNDSNHLTIWEIILKTLSPALWKSLIVCQDKTISQQIKEGVKALDIRIAKYDGKIVTIHKDIVGDYQELVNDIHTSTTGMSDSEKPIIFIVLDWNYNISTEFAEKEEVLTAAQDALTINKGYPKYINHRPSIYLGTSWANMWDKKVKDNYTGATIRTKDNTLDVCQDFINQAQAGDTTVVFTQLTTDAWLLGIELVIRSVIPLAVIIYAIYRMSVEKLINWKYALLVFIPLLCLILQRFIPGLNTPRTLNKRHLDYFKENLKDNGGTSDVIVMLDFL